MPYEEKIFIDGRLQLMSRQDKRRVAKMFP